MLFSPYVIALSSFSDGDKGMVLVLRNDSTLLEDGFKE
jgi:hypothetical protein